MIIRRIQLKHWAVIRHPVDIEWRDGVNVLYGPNDLGKSTLVEALRYLLFARHSSQAGRIKELSPWGTSLSPQGSLEFATDEGEFRVSKRFLSSTYSKLEKKIDGRWEPIAEGDQADKKTVTLVGGGRKKGGGEAKPKYWGVGQVLWMVQGQPFLEENLNERTLTSLQKLIGATVESEEEKALFKRIEDELGEVFTEARRDYKKGSEIQELNEELDRLAERRQVVDSVRREKEDLVVRLDDREKILSQRKEKLVGDREKRDELEKAAEEAQEHRRDREKLAGEVEKLKMEYRELDRRLQDFREMEGEREKLVARRDRKIERQKPLSEEVKGLVEREKKALEKQKKNRKWEKELSRQLEEGRLVGEILDKTADLGDREKERRDQEEWEEEGKGLRRELEELVAPTGEEWRRLNRQHQELEKKRGQLEAIALSIEMTGGDERWQGKVFLDGREEDFDLEPDEVGEWTGYQSVQVRDDGGRKWEVHSGSPDVANLREELEELEVGWEKETAPYGTGDLDELGKLSQRRESLESEVDRREKEGKKRFGRSPYDLQKEIRGLAKWIESRWERIDIDSPFQSYKEGDKKDGQDLGRKVEEIEEQLDETVELGKELDQEVDELATSRSDTEKKLAQLDREIHGVETLIESLEKRLEKWTGQGDSVEEIEKDLEKRAVELDRKEKALAKYEEVRREKEDIPLSEWKGWRSSTKRLEEVVNREEQNVATLKGRIQTLGRGMESPEVLEEKWNELTTRRDQKEVRARAVELLYDLFYHYREGAVRNLAGPIHRLLERDLNTLWGERYQMIHFDQGILPDRVDVGHWEVQADIEHLSFGTREQLWCLYRLALGRLLAQEEMQVVVLDDPLVNTDRAKMARMLEILEGSGEEVQVVIITCEPEPYMALAEANFIDFQEEKVRRDLDDGDI